MAVEWMENFQNYGTGSTGLANMLDGMWAGLSTSTAYHDLVDDPDGVSGTKVFRFNTTTTGGIRRVLPSGAQTTVGVAWRLWLSTLPSEVPRYPTLHLRDGSNNDQVTVSVSTTGTIRVTAGDMSGTASGTPGVLLGETAIPVVTAAAWNHIEVKAVIDDTVGSVEVRVNGAQVLLIENVDTDYTNDGAVEQLCWTSSGNYGSVGHTSYLKDIIVWNATGTENNDFMGDVQVVTLRPDADSSFNWTPSTGATGFDLIDELDPDDADYISAADPPPAASVFTLDDLDPDIVTVKALMPVARMWKTDGGTANVQMTLTTNAANDAGADRPITVAATYWFDISELSPDTGVAWTPTEVNNALFSIDRTI